MDFQKGPKKGIEYVCLKWVHIYFFTKCRQDLLSKMLKSRNQSEENPSLETFFFKATKELRYLWFHLITFNGEGGGLQYFAPIHQLGDSQLKFLISSPSKMCVTGPTGQAAAGFVTRTTRS